MRRPGRGTHEKGAFDPLAVDLRFVGPFELGRRAGYTLGFFYFWALAAGSSWLTCFLQRTDADARR
jgi:hypothetical protein